MNDSECNGALLEIFLCVFGGVMAICLTLNKMFKVGENLRDHAESLRFVRRLLSSDEPYAKNVAIGYVESRLIKLEVMIDEREVGS